MKPGENYDFLHADEATKDKWADGILFAEKLFREEFSMTLRVAYGTMLGVIREQDFIKNDTDVDMTYLSRFHSRQHVIAEMNNIYDHLISMGLVVFDFRTREVNPHGGQIHIYLKEFDMIVDVTTSWIDEKGDFWVFPFGKIAHRDDVLPFKRVSFRKVEVTVPNRPEVMLTKLYKDWHIPIGRGTDGRSREGFRMSWNYKLLS